MILFRVVAAFQGNCKDNSCDKEGTLLYLL